VVEVTSAHEMLHAAYDRLDSGEKSKINGQLSDYYTNKLKDERVLKVIEAYKKTEPTELLNEMHSIFATELNNLTPDLESYYRRYFENRTAVVGFANKYGDEFTRRIAQIEDYQKRLAVLKEKITQQEDSLRAQAEEIEADRRRLNDLRASGQFEEYNAAVLSFNARVNEYNSGVARLRSDIAEYNQLVRLHNELAAELRSLYDSLDTSLATQGAQ
jgi:chromosome segregation ATPase